jgi:phospholipid-translocating ATPase
LSKYLTAALLDILLLRTPEKGGAVFIRTDQLDGETGAHLISQTICGGTLSIAHSDWKLKNAPSLTQSLAHDQQLTSRGRSDKTFSVQAEPPSLEIYKFSGLLNCGSSGSGSAEADVDSGTSCVDNEAGREAGALGIDQESLSIENMLWCNTVLCSSAAIGCVIYTGKIAFISFSNRCKVV